MAVIESAMRRVGPCGFRMDHAAEALTAGIDFGPASMVCVLRPSGSEMKTYTLTVLLYQTFLCSGLCQSFDSAEITRKISPAVVLVTGITGDGKALGSGFVLSSDGKIATNLHVIKDYRSGGSNFHRAKNSTRFRFWHSTKERT